MHGRKNGGCEHCQSVIQLSHHEVDKTRLRMASVDILTGRAAQVFVECS